jgi:hypothetical protein
LPLPIATVTENKEMIITKSVDAVVTHTPLQIDTGTNPHNSKQVHELCYDDDNNDDDDNDEILRCDTCCTYCDWTNYDQYQWKRLSLFFAVLLVVASIIGTLHVVRRMDPKEQFMGWISFGIGLLLLLPAALWIHRIMIACHRWSESEPEKQGYIVQSSTINSFNINTCSNGNGEQELSNTIDHKNATTTAYQTSMMTLADACMRPSCSDMMDDICDPHCRNHTLTNPPGTSRSRFTQNEFSYVVPEMSGCYFIHYPKKDHYHHRHHHHHRTKSTESKRLRKSKRSTNKHNETVEQNVIVPVLEVVIENENMFLPKVIEEGDGLLQSNDHPAILHVSDPSTPLRPHDSSSSSTASCIIESESSVSSISSNDDPTMKELSMWNSMIHDI